MSPNTVSASNDKDPQHPPNNPSTEPLHSMTTRPEAYRLSPMREIDNMRPNERPATGPEIDDLEPEGPESGLDNGVDNGFLPSRKPSFAGSRRPSFAPDLEQPDQIYPDTPTPDVNVYQQKKTLAQGMMDIALLSANANQLRYVLESGRRHPYYFPSLFLIGTSLILQVAVGVGLILNSRYNVKKHADMCQANKFNNLTVIAIFLVTITNVFISAFGIGENPDS